MPLTLRALLVEDEPADAVLVERMLSRTGYDVASLRVDSAEDVRSALAAQAWDVVIADFALPGFRGTDTLGILSERSLDVPLIIVSGAIDASTAYSAMKAGARDYVLKDDLGRLPSVVAREIAEAAERAARRLAESERDTALAKLRKSHALAQALQKIDQTLHSTLQLDEVLQRVLDDGIGVLSADAGAIGIGDGRTRVLQCQRRRESDGFVAGSPDEPRCAVGAAGTWEPSETGPLCDEVSCSAFTCALGSRSIIAAPLVVREKAIGRLLFCTEEIARSFTDDETDFTRKLAASLSLAVANAQLFDDLQERERLGATLNRINESIHSSLNIDGIMQRIVLEAAEGLGCASADMSLLEESGTWYIRCCYGLPVSANNCKMDSERTHYAEMVVDSRRPLAVGDAFDDDRVDGESFKRWGIRAVLAMPLFLRSKTFGVIFFNYDEPHSFSQAELDFAQHLGASLSLAMENARVYEGKRRIAETLQGAILSLPDSIPGLDFAHVYHSATATAMVGGDFYDVFELEGGLLGITMGDISGKGLDAAVLMSFVKHSIRAHAMLEDATPADVLTRANVMLYNESKTEEFATVFFGVLDRRNGKLVYCSAGHPACAVVRPSGEVVGLPSNSPIIGAFPDVAFCNDELMLHWDDLVFLYTDGLIEARSENGMFGEADLFDLLGSLRGCSPQQVVTQVLERVVEFSGGKLSDDVAALAMMFGTKPADA